MEPTHYTLGGRRWVEAWGLTGSWGLAHIDYFYFPLWAVQKSLAAAWSGHQLSDSGLSPRVELALPPLESLPDHTCRYSLIQPCQNASVASLLHTLPSLTWAWLSWACTRLRGALLLSGGKAAQVAPSSGGC